VQLCRSTGRVLAGFSFAECDGGSGQEFRGVPRVQLLRALQARLPEGTVRFGAGVEGMELDGGGGGGSTLQLTGGSKLRCELLVRAWPGTGRLWCPLPLSCPPCTQPAWAAGSGSGDAPAASSGLFLVARCALPASCRDLAWA
jgi:hypothetical protein